MSYLSEENSLLIDRPRQACYKEAMSTLFTKIYHQEIPGIVVAENDLAFVIMDKFPIRKGHLLVVPKKEVAHLFDLPAEEFKKFMEFVQQVSKVLLKVSQAKRVGMLVEGFGVEEHAHLHLVPITGPGQLNMSLAKKASLSQLQIFADKFTTKWQSK